MSNNEPDFLSIVVHDLKTPIGAVKSFLELVEKVGKLNKKQQHFIERASLGLLRMEHMVNDLLDYTRLQTDEVLLNKVECDLKIMVADAIALQSEAAAKRNVDVRLDASESLPSVSGDPNMLSRVVNNLLSNAIKYNRENGRVIVRLKPEDAMLRMEVEDTGDGIMAEDLPRIFERFFRVQATRQREGSGLGLAIVKMIVDKHAGQIWAESEVGVGTKLIVLLPLAKAL